MPQVYHIGSYRVEVAPLAVSDGVRRYRATATREGYPTFEVQGYSRVDALFRIRLRLENLKQGAQQEAAKPRKAKARKKAGKKTRKAARARPHARRDTITVKRKRPPGGRYVSKNGLPPGTDLSASVFFARGAHPVARLWFKTPEGSTAPYVPTRRGTS